MQFHRLTPEHLPLIAPFFEGQSFRTCDLTPGTLLMWREVNDTHFCIEDGVLYLRLTSSRGGFSYLLPIGGELLFALDRLCREAGGEVTMAAVPAEVLPTLEATGRVLECTSDRNSFDYLYRAEDLRCLSGKRYAKKRNLISQFDRAYPDARFEPLTADRRGEVSVFFSDLVRALGTSASRVEELERQGTWTVLEDEGLCGMQGGVLYVGDQIAGFSLGEVLGDTLYTHIEKASRTYKGVYQKLTNLFANAYATSSVTYINREDDAGDEGLRRAKLDYHPHALLEKCRVRLK